MCGIAGMWARGNVAPHDVVVAMTAALKHRGPDSRGVWDSQDGSLALGHARLAIVDLSEQGRQPMASRSGRYMVVFNGEIYNHTELRDELGGGFGWRGHSDTETLLAAIERWGFVEALQRAVGMFAIALWDRETATLTLARDRMGEKPLYYAIGSAGLAFASELKSLRHCPGIDLSLDRAALSGYVRFGFIANPHSAYQGVRKLPPASLMVLRSPHDVAEPEIYWTLPRPLLDADAGGASDADDRRRIEELDALVRRSVRDQMLADVPLGAFLSGGIDSSLIVALMQQGATQRVRTFSMGFGDGGDDELSTARQTAAHLGTDHTELVVTPADVLQEVPRLAATYDEPFADSSQVPTMLLSRLTRQHVTVALTGDAGDELFGGYNRYLVAARLQPKLERWPGWLRRGAGRLLGALPSDAIDAAAGFARRQGAKRVPPVLGEKVARIAQFMAAPTGIEAYLGTVSQWMEGAPLLSPAAAPALADLPGTALAQRMMWWDMQTYLTDDILVKVDRAAMASSLETRVPFLDHRIVEFALRTPMRCKIRGRQTKWLLRQLLARHLPQAWFDRPKQGFSVPLDAWLRGPLRDWAESLLSAPRLAESGLLDVERVRRTWSEHLSGRRNHLRALWTVLMLQAWLAEESCASREDSPVRPNN